MTAAQGRANRRRGATAEVRVVNWLRANGWPDARRYLAGDGRQPGDIDGVPGVVIEVKDTKASAWPTWRAQVLAEAGGRVPVVVRRTRGVTDVGMWEAETVWTAWVGLVGSKNAPPYVECPRTGRLWVRTTFYELMEALR